MIFRKENKTLRIVNSFLDLQPVMSGVSLSNLNFKTGKNNNYIKKRYGGLIIRKKMIRM